MVALAKQRRRRKSVPAWHARFLEMLPAIVQYARISFRHLGPEARAEAVQEVVCNTCCAVARLAELDKLDLAYPSVLARFGVAQVKDGRKTGSKLNCRDVLSPYCQRLKHVTVERLDRFDEEEDQWREAVVEDHRAGPAETAAARLDIADWFAGLPRRKRRIAQTLASGETTKQAARKFRVSPGRISQTRRELERAWQDFQGEAVFA